MFAGKFIELMIYTLSLNINKKIEENIKAEIDSFLEVEYEKYLKGDYFFYNLLYGKIEDYEESEEDNYKKVNIDKIVNFLETIDKIELTELDRIVENVPFNSQFSTKSRFLSDKDEDEDFVDEDETFSYDLKEVNESLIRWKTIFEENIKLNVVSLYEIIDKFFKNLYPLKSSEKAETPLEFMQRVVLIFINAVAYFENTDIRVANTYIAVGKNFNLKNTLSKSNSATKNIKPMFNKKNSLTKALFFHPIISHILFPDSVGKLKNLRFVNKTNQLFDAEAFLSKFYDYNLKAIQITHKISLLNRLLDECTNEELKSIYKIDNFKDRFLSEHFRTASNKQLEEFNHLRKIFLDKIK